MGFQFTLFVLTPDELKKAIAPFTLFIANAHVPIDYTSTPSEVFVSNYTDLYERLCSGEKIDHRKHNKILDYFSITTDISSVQFGKEHIYLGKKYKSYLGTSRGYAPYFSPFTFSVYRENNKISVGTRGSWMVYHTDIMGFQLVFPKLTKTDAEECNVTSERDWESYADYKLFKDHVTKHTSVFRFVKDGIEKKTQIRVSSEAKKMLPAFHCIKSFEIEVK